MGTIEDKYSIAVSTACKSGLEMVVIEKNSDAKIILEYIRNNTNLLRANGVNLQGNINFLTLDKVDPVPNIIQFPEVSGVKLLFNLIKPIDNKFRDAF